MPRRPVSTTCSASTCTPPHADIGTTRPGHKYPQRAAQTRSFDGLARKPPLGVRPSMASRRPHIPNRLLTDTPYADDQSGRSCRCASHDEVVRAHGLGAAVRGLAGLAGTHSNRWLRFHAPPSRLGVGPRRGPCRLSVRVVSPQELPLPTSLPRRPSPGHGQLIQHGLLPNRGLRHRDLHVTGSG